MGGLQLIGLSGKIVNGGIWTINLLLLLVLAEILQGCALGTYHYVWNNEEAKVFDRKTGKECHKVVTQITEDYVIDVYGKDCQVSLRRRVDKK